MEDKTFHELVRKHVESEMDRHFAVVRAACEASLRGGQHGVLVLGHCDARPDYRVPYGEIWDAEACPGKFPLDES